MALPQSFSADLERVWRTSLLLALPLVVLGASSAMVLGRGDAAWDRVDFWLYSGLIAGLVSCWLMALSYAQWRKIDRALWILSLSAMFFCLKLSLLLLLASPPTIVKELAECFFWLTPLLLYGVFKRDDPKIYRATLSLLWFCSGVSAVYVVRYLSDAAASAAVDTLLQINLAAWVTLLVARLYLPQHQRFILASGERAALEKLAFTDLLTGLPNRLALEQFLERHLAEQPSQPLTLLFIDLDGFKVANDTLGHAEGDRILACTAQELTQAAPAGSLVCRLSGDEFVIALPGRSGKDGEMLGHNLKKGVAAPGSDSGVMITASIGLSVYPEDAQTASELLRHADSAMYAVKRQGKDGIRRYRLADAATERTQMLARDLLGGLQRGEFSLVYQPLFRFPGGQMTKVEALLRWQHPEFGAVAPSDFIAVAEQSGAILALGEWALREACRAAAGWQNVTVCVNVSALQLFQPHFAQQTAAILGAAQLRPSRLELELTETLLLSSDEALINVLGELRQLGVGVSIDDFGTGYSNLSRLQTLPIQGLKIDRSFTAALLSSPNERAYPFYLLDAMVTIGQLRGIEVTIEGIETAQQLEWVRSLGQVTGQGFWLAEPVSAEQLSVNAIFRAELPSRAFPPAGAAQ